MKIVLAGASGTGKSTLAKWIAEHFALSYEENSAGLIMLPEDKEHLKTRYGYAGSAGQMGVLKRCYDVPGFGAAFQMAVLKARTLLAQRENYVYDRSALDPAVFWINQVSQDVSEQDTIRFLKECARVMSEYDLIIYLPLQTTDRPLTNIRIEENGGRIANTFYQWKIDRLFFDTYKLIKELNAQLQWGFRIPSMGINDVWDWDRRIFFTNRHLQALRIKLENQAGL